MFVLPLRYLLKKKNGGLNPTKSLKSAPMKLFQWMFMYFMISSSMTFLIKTALRISGKQGSY